MLKFEKIRRQKVNAIITATRERGLENFCRWIRSMLESTLVHTSLMGSSLSAKVLGGYLQGGVVSPLLWNLVVDRLLSVTNGLGFSTFGCADDIVIIFQGKFAHTVRDVMNVAVKWAAKEGLKISLQKTAIFPFTQRKKTEGLGPLVLRGKELIMLDEVKYLGVILDSKLNWNQHLQKVIKKTQTTFALVRCTCGKKWGLRPGMMHWLYTRALDPSYFMVPWFGGPRSCNKPPKIN